MAKNIIARWLFWYVYFVKGGKIQMWIVKIKDLSRNVFAITPELVFSKFWNIFEILKFKSNIFENTIRVI